MSKHLPRWIWASVAKHFNARREGQTMYFEGEDRPAETDFTFEFRMDGPDIIEVSRNYFKISIEINVLINCQKDKLDAFKIHRLVGTIVTAFTKEISVFKLGNGVDDNPSTLLGCLILKPTDTKGETIVHHFGALEPTNNLLQATVEGHYTMTLNGEN